MKNDANFLTQFDETLNNVWIKLSNQTDIPLIVINMKTKINRIMSMFNKEIIYKKEAFTAAKGLDKMLKNIINLRN
jgi:hypothetical protein